MDSSESSSLRRSIGFVLGIVLFAAVWAGPVPEGLSPAAAKTGAIGLLMAAWWITEAIPIAATALVPLVLFPLLGVSDMSAAATPYANPLIFLFMGGFMIAQAMQTWNLHRRIALGIVRWVGVRPASIVIGFILASAFLSMWVSNTATALMMLPIGLSIIDLTADRLEADIASAAPHFGLVLVLSIAYACNVGGIATLIGTPPNALLAGFMSESYGVEVGFAEWMMIGLPVALCLLPFVYLILTWIYPIELDTLPGGADLIDQEIADLGDISRAERRVGIVFVLTALLWITRPLLTDLLPALSDAGIAMGAALVLFMIPSGTEDRALLGWPEAEDLPWGVLILFGGGLSLAAQISDTGLAEWVGGGVSALSGWPVLALLLATVGKPIPACRAGGPGGELRVHAPGGYAAECHHLRKRPAVDSPDEPGRRVAEPALHHPRLLPRLPPPRPRLRRRDRDAAALGRKLTTRRSPELFLSRADRYSPG